MAKKEEEIIIKIKSNASEVTKDSKDLQEQTEKTTQAIKDSQKANAEATKTNEQLGKSIADNTVVTKGLDDATGGLYSIIKNLTFGLKDTVVAMFNNTKATMASTTATTASTVATGGFRGALNALKVAIASNPLGLLLTALSTVIAYFAFATDASDKFNKSLSYDPKGLDRDINKISEETKQLLIDAEIERNIARKKEIDDKVDKKTIEKNELEFQNKLKEIIISSLSSTNREIVEARGKLQKEMKEYSDDAIKSTSYELVKRKLWVSELYKSGDEEFKKYLKMNSAGVIEIINDGEKIIQDAWGKHLVANDEHYKELEKQFDDYGRQITQKESEIKKIQSESGLEVSKFIQNLRDDETKKEQDALNIRKKAQEDYKKKQEERDKEFLKQNEDVYNQKQSYQIHSEQKLIQEKLSLEKKYNEELAKIQHLRNEDIIYFDKEGKQQVANQYKDQKELLDIYFNEQKRIKDEQIALNQEFNSFDFDKVADNILKGTDKLENYEGFGDILNFGDNQEKYDTFVANVNKRKQLIEESTIQLDSYQVDTTREVQEKLFELRTANIERERDLKLQELEDLNATEEEKQAVREYYENLRVKEVENSQKAIESIQELELQGYLSLADGVSGIFDALASQSKEGASLYKGLAIASVMIDTTASAIASYKAMVKQYADVPMGGTIGVIAGIASAAAITLNGLNAVNKIKRVKTDGSEKGGGGGGGAQMIAPNVQFVSSSENQIANTINDTNEAMNMQETPPVKTYVVTSDVETGLELDRNAINRSSL